MAGRPPLRMGQHGRSAAGTQVHRKRSVGSPVPLPGHRRGNSTGAPYRLGGSVQTDAASLPKTC